MKKVFPIDKQSSRWLRALGVFLAVMALFTAASRAAASFTVPRVSVEEIARRKIWHEVTAEGQMEPDGEMAVVCEPNLLLESLNISEGESVTAGDVLAVLDAEDLAEAIESVNGEIRSLELTNQSLEENKRQAQQKRERDIARAAADCEEAKAQGEAAVWRSEQELAKAKEALAAAKKSLEQADEADKRELREAYQTCRATVAEKEEALAAAYESSRSAQKQAVRNLEDAQQPAASDTDGEINSISMEDLKKKQRKLKKLQEQQGNIYAPQSGVVTKVFVSVGQRTTDTALLTMSSGSGGVKFVAHVGAEDAEYLAKGDTVTLRGVGKSADNCRILSVRAEEDGAVVTVALEGDLFSVGEHARMTAVRESQEYPCTVPVSALVEEEQKMYVLLMEREDTVLGEQYVARKREVTVEDRNDSIAALDGSALESEASVIVASDRYVGAGDRVRLAEE